ncbi:MAG: glutathione S-transferase family protein [Gammaproteobacteria bacterium]|nr:glutathione S-transferase family protein [Gammaproteobacteria bacterium]
MFTLYDYLPSGNGYKVRLVLRQLELPFRYIEIDILRGESRSSGFLSRNPNGKIPTLEYAPGAFLSESNAIMYYLAIDSHLMPSDRLHQAQVMQWLFFEQYSHEPYIAVSRFLLTHGELDDEKRAVLMQKKPGGEAALRVMNQHLEDRQYFVAEQYTIADIGLYAYTHVAAEGGFDLAHWPAIQAWLERVARQPLHCRITDQF